MNAAAAPVELQFAPEFDVTLSFANAAVFGSAMLSTDPGADAGAAFGSSGVVTGLIAAFSGDLFGQTVIQSCPLSYPVRKGQTIFFSANSVGYIQLFYSDSQLIPNHVVTV